MSKASPCIVATLAIASSAVAAPRPPLRPAKRSAVAFHAPVLARAAATIETPCKGIDALPSSGHPAFELGESLGYEISVAGAYVGRLELEIGRPRTVDGRNVIPLFGRARTTGFVSTLQPFEGRYMALVDPETLEPVGVRVEGTYGGDPRWEKIRFLDAQRRIDASFLLMGKELTRTYVGDHDLIDILTMLYAARRVSLSEGLSGCQDVFGARRLWRMDARVKGVVDVDTAAGKKTAYEVATIFDRRPTPGLDNGDRPRFEIDVFLAKDDTQAPLAFVMRQSGITAEARLVRWSLSGGKGEEAWAF